MKTISASDIARQVNATATVFSSPEYALESKYSQLITDSRSLTDPAVTIFAALRTDVNDGHRYIPELIDKGVGLFIVEEIPTTCYNDANFIKVESTEDALACLARERAKTTNKGIVITGSRGKTKMKELLFRAMLPYADVRRSPRSWNSGIGVPLSLWDMTKTESSPDVIITEAAIDGPGQGDKVLGIIEGSHRIGVVTPLTTEHDEAFASHRDKVREKAKIVSRCDIIFYDDSDPDIEAALLSIKDSRPAMKLIAVNTGSHSDIYHAIAYKVLEYLGIDTAEIDKTPTADTRMLISQSVNGCTLLRDRFTPDARTLCGTLDFMRRHSDCNRTNVLILGDVLHTKLEDCELSRLYTGILDTAKAMGVDFIHAIGEEFNRIFKLLPDRYQSTDSGVRPAYGKTAEYTSRIAGGEFYPDSQILIFGKSDHELEIYSNALDAVTHDTTLEVDLDAIVYNYNYYRHLLPPGTGMIAMVKASAYGVGAVEVGRILQSQGAAYLAVAVIEEGVALRKAGITTPIVVLNPITNRYEALFAHSLEPSVFSIEELNRLISEVKNYGASEYPVHIKLDTGMHRVGFIESQLGELAEVLNRQSAVKVASVFTHLATADCLDMDEYTLSQISAFTDMSAKLQKAIGCNFKRHILNTAGMMRFADSCSYDMARLGIGLYGIPPYPVEPSPLKPVATLRTHIISIKHWPAGTPIGYGCRGITSRPSIIATIPVGYADGINRHLGRGAASFVINGVECPTIGNICMDQCMVDVTEAPDVKVGDSVEIFGRNMHIEQLADTLETIPYEVLTSVSNRVIRTYIKR